MDEILSLHLEEVNALASRLGHCDKRRKIEQNLAEADYVPILTGVIQIKSGTPKGKLMRILLDSGASTSIITKPFVKKLRVRSDTQTKWSVAGGKLTTNERCKIHLQLPDLSPSLSIVKEVHVTDKVSNRYDMIMGRDLLSELGINLDFKDETMTYHTQDDAHYQTI